MDLGPVQPEQMKSLALQVKRATDEQVSGTKLISLASSESMKMAKSITDATKEEAYGSELIVKSIGAVTEATSMRSNLRLRSSIDSRAGGSSLARSAS